MTIEEKYLELRKKKSVNRKNNRYLFTYLENRPKSRPYIALFKEEISHKMCWIFHETLPIWLPIRCPLKNIVYASWKVLKICLRASKRWLILTNSVRCFDHCGDVLICLLINTNARSHWLKSVAWPVGPIQRRKMSAHALQKMTRDRFRAIGSEACSACGWDEKNNGCF